MQECKDEPRCAELEAETLAESQRVASRIPSLLTGTFASLAHRDFLLFWSGAWVSNIGNWLQSVALGWLILQMTDSSIYLGLVNFTSSLPVFLFSFLAGVWADRHHRRSIILVAQGTAMVFSLGLALLVGSGGATVPGILSLSFLSGLAMAWSFPAWQAFIAEIVPRRDLLNAIALNSAQFHAARLVGPPVAGFIIARWSIAGCFLLNSLSFLFVIAALLAIRPVRQPAPAPGSAWASFGEAIAHVRQHRPIFHILLGIGLLTLCGPTFTIVLLPQFARDVLGGDAATLGLLMGSSGLGALTGALTVATLAARVDQYSLIRRGLLVFSLATVTLSFTGHPAAAAPCLAFSGFAFLAIFSSANTLLQVGVPPHLRGRVMALFIWVFLGWMPLGSLLAGFTAHLVGPARAITLGALVPLALSIFGFRGDRDHLAGVPPGSAEPDAATATPEGGSGRAAAGAGD
jgi:MFS family permease